MASAMRVGQISGLLLLCTAAAFSPPAAPVAQAKSAPQRSLDQYNHRAWRLVDGAPPDIWALAQSPDGFLWLGTGAGLYRFDGLFFEEIEPRIGQYPSSNITALLATPDGTIWIGYYTGEISRLRGNRLQNFHHSGSAVEQFAQERDGTVWAARSGPQGGLFRFNSGWSRVAANRGMPDTMAYSVIVARNGSVWVSTERHILMRPAGGTRFEAVRRNRGIARLAQAPDGQVWVSGDVSPIPHMQIKARSLAHVPLSNAKAARADRMIFSREGALWQTLFGGGVTRISDLSESGRSSPRFERFDQSRGLTSPVAVPLLEDREGNIWIGTNLGLNRLRPVNAVAVLPVGPQTISGFLIATTENGAIYVAGGQALYRAMPGEALERFHTLPEPVTMLEAEGEDLVIGQGDRVMRLRGTRLVLERLPHLPGAITSWSRTPQGELWVTVDAARAYRLNGGEWRAAAFEQGNIPEEAIVATSVSGGGTWMYGSNGVFHRSGTKFVAVPEDAGPQVGRIALISEGRAGFLVGGDLGLARREGSRFRTLSGRENAPLRGISGIVQTDSCEVWINGIGGLLRTTCADLDAAFDNPRAPLRHQMFTAADGLPGVAQQDRSNSTAVRGGDGRIWVANNVGIGWIDPQRLVSNMVPPPVVIRRLEANGRTWTGSAASLPAGTQNLRVAYTALSLAASERVRFRYRLIGVDNGWVDAGTRREAFYANLPSGEWRFQVIAANNDGIWNTTGASMTVSIAPMFYQTGWFRLLCLAVFLLGGWLFYAWRVREHRSRERARVEAQLGERERIARELHDTLLQGMQGLMLRFQAAANATIPGSRAHKLAESALERADDLVIQARDRVRALRAIAGPVDLLKWLEQLADRYRADGLNVSIRSEGKVKPLLPEVAEQLLSILEEAMANVLRHAQATGVTIEVRQGERDLSICIVDDGIGLPDEIRLGNGKSGHFGLRGMRERAANLGGALRLSRSSEGGTSVELCVPLPDS